ncbi:MAG: helix-turn-helix domain-containing protein [Nitrospirota bacterium]
MRINNKKTVGYLIKRLRKAKGMSQMELAEKVEVSYQQIQKYEKGVSNISVERLKQVAKALNVPMGVFFSGERDIIAEPSSPYGKLSDDEQLLLQLFREIRDKKLRQALLNLIKSLVK